MITSLTLGTGERKYANVVQSYRMLIGHPEYDSSITGVRFPVFDGVFEEYITRILDEQTRIDKTQIEEELRELGKKGVFLDNPDFLPDEYRVTKQIELLSFMQAMHFSFLYKGEVQNPPVKEVW